MNGVRIALYISAFIYTMVCILGAAFEIDELLNAIDTMPAYLAPDKYPAVLQALRTACLPAAVTIMLTYLISCVDRD